MAPKIKVNVNDPCPCWSGRKFKHCCRGKIDWEEILRSKASHIPYMSARGRNILFAESIFDALQLNTGREDVSLPAYKKAFTEQAVRKIYESIVEIWPVNTDIVDVLSRTRTDVSGLYIGDYDPEYAQQALVRHSIYANKILLVDPFNHPYILSDKYNPLLHPAQYRAQTLKNVNFYMACMPWIEAGLLEFIRTPADFDRDLNHQSMLRAQRLGDVPDIKKAIESDVAELSSRHERKQMLEQTLLSHPDALIRKMFRDLPGKVKGTTFGEDDFLAHIQRLRDNDPNFLEPIGPDNGAQLHMISSGGPFEPARMSAQITGSYLFTDLRARWAMIQHDQPTTPENSIWAPFAKALQNTKLQYLNNLSLNHAMGLRSEGRLEGVRTLLMQVWEKARGDDVFDDAAAIRLANNLVEAINAAEAEWADIRKSLTRTIATAAAAGITAAGPAVAAGHAAFMAGAAAVSSVGIAAWHGFQRTAYAKRYPAAFFMDLRDG